ncbi:MAG: hypothetical protein AMQ74_00550 [Candidatus Methanofastidiosum methylothiophilum]|uniref:Uncharacterized protein n=1 Tax=Candidatus Methanofastidiosum methylothiophilum TaxID=1705564 RepID=A0A150J7A6_9EURY|nr:MAG: hypothetical protein AMQ74_00550 [Candidatus Methanofastidiosum methylthiophilus]NMC76713.1 hypothetical protein [Candidatus Methanofastidiosa archaeon]
MKKDTYFKDIFEMLDQFKTAIKRLHDQGVNVSILENDIRRITDKINISFSDSNDETLNIIRKEVLGDCIFLRKKIADAIRKQIRDIIENEIK